MRSSSLSASGRSSKTSKTADLAQKYSDMQASVAKKEAELERLKKQTADEERGFRELSRQMGAREQRVEVSTLRGAPPTKQLGGDMANAIAKRQARRKEHMKSKLNKLLTKLGSEEAANRALRREIDDRRLERVHHLSAVRAGEGQVESCNAEIGDLIVGAQRAYAEKETWQIKQAELKKKAAEERAVIELRMTECAGEIDVIEQEWRTRDEEVAEVEREVAFVVAETRRVEE